MGFDADGVYFPMYERVKQLKPDPERFAVWDELYEMDGIYVPLTELIDYMGKNQLPFSYEEADELWEHFYLIYDLEGLKPVPFDSGTRFDEAVTILSEHFAQDPTAEVLPFGYDLDCAWLPMIRYADQDFTPLHLLQVPAEERNHYLALPCVDKICGKVRTIYISHAYVEWIAPVGEWPAEIPPHIPKDS